MKLYLIQNATESGAKTGRRCGLRRREPETGRTHARSRIQRGQTARQIAERGAGRVEQRPALTGFTSPISRFRRGRSKLLNSGIPVPESGSSRRRLWPRGGDETRGPSESIYYTFSPREKSGRRWKKVKPVVAGIDPRFLRGCSTPPAGNTAGSQRTRTATSPRKRRRENGLNSTARTSAFPPSISTGRMRKNLPMRLARLGYTSVRFHHYDNSLSDPKGNDSTVFLPEKIDQLDYLFACLKKRGIYITLDLYCSRRFRNGENCRMRRSARDMR